MEKYISRRDLLGKTLPVAAIALDSGICIFKLVSIEKQAREEVRVEKKNIFEQTKAEKGPDEAALREARVSKGSHLWGWRLAGDAALLRYKSMGGFVNKEPQREGGS